MDKSELTLVIGDKHLSSWSMRPWLLMKQFQIPFQEKLIRLDLDTTKAEIAQSSPSGRVPVLMDHDIVVWDSLAICEYLADKFPRLNLWPEGKKQKAWARSMSAEMHSSFASLRKECPMNLLRVHADRQTISESTLADLARVDEIFHDCRVAHKSQGIYLFGDFSIADAMYLPVISRIRSYALSLKEVASAEYYNLMIASPLFKMWSDEATKELP